MLTPSLSPCSLPVVEYMECDIGQAEFTPPGCISLSSITEPILGMCSAASAVTETCSISEINRVFWEEALLQGKLLPQLPEFPGENKPRAV